MADFVAVLKKTIDGLGENTPAMREKVYREGPQHRRRKARRDQPAAAGRGGRAPEARARGRDRARSRPAIPARPTIRSPSSRTSLPIAARTKAGRGPLRRAPVRRCLPDPMSIRSRGRAALRTASRPSQRSGRAAARRAVRRRRRRRRRRSRLRGAERRRRNFAPLIAAVVALAVLVGGGYAVWLNRDDFMAMLGIGGGQTVASAPVGRRLRPAPAAAKKTVNDADAAGEGCPEIHAAAEQRRLRDRSRPGRRHRLARRRHLGRLGDAAARAGRPDRGAAAPPIRRPPAASRCTAASGSSRHRRGRSSRRQPTRRGRRRQPTRRAGSRDRPGAADAGGTDPRLRQRPTDGAGHCRGRRRAAMAPPRRPRRGGPTAAAQRQPGCRRPEGDLLRGAHQRCRRFGRSRHDRVVAGAGIARQRPAARAGHPRRGDDPRQGHADDA